MLQATWSILLSLAPWLLLGMAIAGALHVGLPPGFVRRHLAGRAGVFKAVALGVPLPLCSCGVIPAGLGLKRDGASDGASVGFLISTPQTGVDSILVSAAFLGWPFALFKVLSAAVTGIVGGLLTDRGLKQSGSSTADSDARPAGRGLREMVDHALSILGSIWRWLVLGILVSVLIELFVPPQLFATLDGWGPFVPVAAALLVSLPLYVCATASVPIAAALVGAGMPTGAALVFLMAGPATNVATIGAIYRALGRRALAYYLATIVVGSVAFGLLFDFLLEGAAMAPAHHHDTAAWWEQVSAIVLLVLLAWFAGHDVRRGWQRLVADGRRSGHPVEIPVDGMTCQGCVSKLETALRGTEGVSAVRVTLEPSLAVVHGSLAPERVREIIRAAGFAPRDGGGSG